MSANQLIGATMLLLFLAGVFALIASATGFRIATLVCAAAILATLFVAVAVTLLASGCGR